MSTLDAERHAETHRACMGAWAQQSAPIIRAMTDLQIIARNTAFVMEDGKVVETRHTWSNPEAQACYARYEELLETIKLICFEPMQRAARPAWAGKAGSGLQLRRLQIRRADMTEWQSIETAPKDGSYFLACDVDSPWQGGEENPHIVQWEPKGGVWRIQLDGQRCTPTHWMALPEMPVPPTA